MKASLISLVSGIIFAAGLSLSGMVNPEKVRGFLDIFSLHGGWDFSLVFVMGGAVMFNFFAFKFLQKRKPMCSNEHFLPTKKDLDSRLIVGATLFGIGWGLVGICPGPALVNLVTFKSEILVFVVSMLAGMFIFNQIEKRG